MPKMSGGGGVPYPNVDDLKPPKGNSLNGILKPGYTNVPGVGVVKTGSPKKSGGSSGGGGGLTGSGIFTGGGGGFNEAGSLAGGGGGTGGAPSTEDYLAGDSAYQAQLAALNKALADYQADQTNQDSQYNTQYGQGLASLGYNQPDPTDPNAVGGWNFQDQNTSAGRSYQNQLNDFASRGELQSSGYGTALDNLTRSLDTQKGSMDTAKQSFEDNLASQLAQQQNSNTLSIQQAKADAIARRAAQFGLS